MLNAPETYQYFLIHLHKRPKYSYFYNPNLDFTTNTNRVHNVTHLGTCTVGGGAGRARRCGSRRAAWIAVRPRAFEEPALYWNSLESDIRKLDKLGGSQFRCYCCFV